MLGVDRSPRCWTNDSLITSSSIIVGLVQDIKNPSITNTVNSELLSINSDIFCCNLLKQNLQHPFHKPLGMGVKSHSLSKKALHIIEVPGINYFGPQKIKETDLDWKLNATECQPRCPAGNVSGWENQADSGQGRDKK